MTNKDIMLLENAYKKVSESIKGKFIHEIGCIQYDYFSPMEDDGPMEKFNQLFKQYEQIKYKNPNKSKYIKTSISLMKEMKNSFRNLDCVKKLISLYEKYPNILDDKIYFYVYRSLNEYFNIEPKVENIDNGDIHDRSFIEAYENLLGTIGNFGL
jgi:hypothetical protein